MRNFPTYLENITPDGEQPTQELKLKEGDAHLSLLSSIQTSKIKAEQLQKEYDAALYASPYSADKLFEIHQKLTVERAKLTFFRNSLTQYFPDAI